MMKANNKYIWALIIGGVAFMLIPTGISDVLNNAMRALSFVFGITMICLDAAEVRKAGFTAPSRWWALLPPVYIWKRGNQTGQGRSLFWSYIGSLVTCIAVAALMAFAMSFHEPEVSQPAPVPVEEPAPSPQTAIAPVEVEQSQIAPATSLTENDCNEAVNVLTNLSTRRNQGDKSPMTFHEKAALTYAEECNKQQIISLPMYLIPSPDASDERKAECKKYNASRGDYDHCLQTGKSYEQEESEQASGSIIEGGSKPAAGTQSCDVVFMRDGKVTGREQNYAEVVFNEGYFTYDAVHGNRGDSTGNNAFDANNGEGAFNPANQLKLKATEPDGARVFESRAIVMMGDEQHKYVYAQRSKTDGSQEFYVTDTTSKFAINMVNCKPE